MTPEKITIVPIPSSNGVFGYRFINYRLRDLTAAERYEGWMRGDFSSRKIVNYDSVSVVRLASQ